MLIEAQRALPLARYWDMGETSSSDGQHFPAGGTGEAMNLVNAHHGTVPGASLRKLAACSRQNGLALALREVRWVERTLFILDWLTGRDL
jgi:TnpA family transposase